MRAHPIDCRGVCILFDETTICFTQVAEVRTGLGMSQAQLAALLGVHHLTVSKWERRVLRPTSHQEILLSSFARLGGRKSLLGMRPKTLSLVPAHKEAKSQGDALPSDFQRAVHVAKVKI